MPGPIQGSLKDIVTRLLGRANVSLRGGALFAYGVRFGNAGFVFLLHILLARWMGAFDFGIYVLVWTWVTLLGLVSALGLGASALRFIPEYKVQGRTAALRGFLLSSRAIGVGAATAVALVGGLLLFAFRGLVEEHYFVPFLIGLGCVPAFALLVVQGGIARSYEWVPLSLVPSFVTRPVSLLALAAIAFALGAASDAKVAMVCVLASIWLSAIGQYLFLRRRLKRAVPEGAAEFRVTGWLRASVPMLFVDGFHLLMINTDVLALSFFAGPAEVGLYFAAAKLLALVSMVSFAVNVVASHKFAAFHASGDQEGLRGFVRKVAGWSFWPSFAAAAVVLAIGYPVLALFGPEFTAAYPVVFILTIGILARASIGPSERLLNAVGEQDSCARIYLSSLAMNIVLNIALIPLFGLFGAAAATSIALTFESFLLNRRVFKSLGANAFALAPAR